MTFLGDWINYVLESKRLWDSEAVPPAALSSILQQLQ